MNMLMISPNSQSKTQFQKRDAITVLEL